MSDNGYTITEKFLAVLKVAKGHGFRYDGIVHGTPCTNTKQPDGSYRQELIAQNWRMCVFNPEFVNAFYYDFTETERQGQIGKVVMSATPIEFLYSQLSEDELESAHAEDEDTGGATVSAQDESNIKAPEEEVSNG